MAPASRGAALQGCVAAALLCLSACAVGPDYHKPSTQLPASFKEGADWERAQADPQKALSSSWWLDYGDARLTQLVEAALRANQSIAAAEAAYRVAQATVSATRAALLPTVSASVSARRSSSSAATAVVNGIPAGVANTITASAAASWEPDLWGKVRRQIEASKASAQASDAQLAGQRLSIAASVAGNYFALRQADLDIVLLQRQQLIDERLLAMIQANYAVGAASSDQVLFAQDTVEATIAARQATQTVREQYEHALAVLTGIAPGDFAVESVAGYQFTTPAVPLSLPSQLLERRYDVVVAERNAAAANARIGVAQAAFYPSLDLAAEGGFQHNRLAHLFTLPNRFWTLGPTLAQTLFDAGARSAAVREARASYDEEVANYRETVLAAFQSVEDSLSSWNHLQQQAQAYSSIFQRNQRLLVSTRTQRELGTQSEANLLTQELTLLQAEQNLRDTQAALAQSSVALIRNLGGGWQWDESRQAAATAVRTRHAGDAEATTGPLAQ